MAKDDRAAPDGMPYGGLDEGALAQAAALVDEARPGRVMIALLRYLAADAIRT